jgi:hypothetical protein
MLYLVRLYTKIILVIQGLFKRCQKRQTRKDNGISIDQNQIAQTFGVLVYQTVPVGVANNCREAARTGTRASRPPLCIRKPNEFGRNAKTGWRTFADTSWRSVQTFLVLLHTEAGGTPAFQSAAASRQASPAPTGMIWNINAFPAPVVGER